MPTSPIGGMSTVKIFVLYLMRNINYPLSFVTINDIVMQNDYVMYLDFAMAFHEMLDGGLIVEDGKDEHGEALYSVTRKGTMVAEQLRSDILPIVLDQSMTYALRYLDFQRRGVSIDCATERRADNTFDVILTLKEKDKTIFETKINVDSEYRAKQMRKTFRDRPDVVYRGVVALLTGKVDYLFDK
ncbi:MAG: DUF4364 family protein [Ruminococcaceae bacterium]|nr:DUF4364 family protein [Oscillospiraceae bacterium]